MGDVLVAGKWATNGHLIADVAKLGYLNGSVLDTTLGESGVFWKQWRPERLVGCTLGAAGADVIANFTRLPFADRSFDAVVIDAPYKLNGTPSEPDERYGVHIPTRWQDRMTLIMDGVEECARVAREHLLVKCMDQVCSGRKRWQTIEVVKVAEGVGWELADRFDMLGTPRPQRGPQVHARSNYSSLLVFGPA
jgi:hypothetical protein